MALAAARWVLGLRGTLRFCVPGSKLCLGSRAIEAKPHFRCEVFHAGPILIGEACGEGSLVKLSGGYLSGLPLTRPDPLFILA